MNTPTISLKEVNEIIISLKIKYKTQGIYRNIKLMKPLNS